MALYIITVLGTMNMQRGCHLLCLSALLLVAHVAADAQVQFLGRQYFNQGTSTHLSGSGLSAILSSLLNVQPSDVVGPATSQQVCISSRSVKARCHPAMACNSPGHTCWQVEQVLRPNVFARPQALLSVQVIDRAGGACPKHFIAEEQGAHEATVAQQGKATAAQQVLQSLSSVAASGVAAGSLRQKTLGAIPGCSDLCMEQLLAVREVLRCTSSRMLFSCCQTRI